MLTAVALAAVALLTSTRTSTAADIATMSWLAGCWALENSEPGTLEMWMQPAGGAMVGMSRTIRGGKMSAYEFMQIRDEANTLVFIAQPSNQAQTKFIASRIADREIVFENLAHDFPQRVIYKLKGTDILHARIEGMREGKLRGIDYMMKKVPCE